MKTHSDYKLTSELFERAYIRNGDIHRNSTNDLLAENTAYILYLEDELQKQQLLIRKIQESGRKNLIEILSLLKSTT